MKILKVIVGTYETVYTDLKPEGSGIYRRNFTGTWEHLIDRNGRTWLRLFDHEQIEYLYQEWQKKESKT